MSRNDADRLDDEYRDREHDDRDYDDREYGEGDDSLVPIPGSFAWPVGLSSWYGDEPPDADRYDDDAGAYDAADERTHVGETDETWLDEGVIGLLLVAGTILFVIPEPATSGIGILLVAVGVFAWLLDALA